MKTPSAPAHPIYRGGTQSIDPDRSQIFDPQHQSTFDRFLKTPLPFGVHPLGCLHFRNQIRSQRSKIRPPFAKRTSFIGHHSRGGLGKPNSPNSFIARFFTVFTFVSRSIHDFHAKKTPARIRMPPVQKPHGMLTFLLQVTDLTLFNPFYLRAHARSHRQHSTSFSQKTPVIPPIPLNSTYAVPPKK